MTRQCSIARARDNLPGIVHEVEHGCEVELTRRGRPVAVVLSIQEYRRLKAGKVRFAEAYAAFRRDADLESLGITPEYFDSLRDWSPGRPVDL